jgi:hypothetical protein
MSIEGPDRHQQSTLLDFFRESQIPANGRILNVLDLPQAWELRPIPN